VGHFGILVLGQKQIPDHIPVYQRPYSWNTEQVEELWDDIYEAFENGDEEYFLGSIILTRSKIHKDLDIIDGQQRLTTLTILFCTLRDLYFNDLEDLAKKNSVLGRIKNTENNQERLKFRTQQQHQNEFEQEILKSINFDKRSSERKKNKFFNTACIFRDKIEKVRSEDPELIEKFTNYILQRTRLITIECTQRSFAIKLFQVLNNRGMDLTASDLIKSYLMSQLGNSDEEFAVFNSDWIEIEKKAEELGEDLTKLFTYYEYYLLANNPKKTLYEELEKQFKNKDPKDIIYEFKKVIKYYDQIVSEKSKEIYSLKYLKHQDYWRTILISAKLAGWEKEQFINLSSELRRFYYLYWMADYTMPKIKQTSFKLIQWIKDNKDLNYIKEGLNKKLKRDRVLQRVLRNLNEDIYDSAWTKPLLLLIEYQQTDDSNINFVELEKYLHVEHILPQSYSKIPYWSERFNPQIADSLVNTLGNLTLLSGKKNIGASNKPFTDKLSIYKGKGIDGVTGFRITQRIADLYSEWTKDKVEERRLWLLEEIEKLFDIDTKMDLSEIEEHILDKAKLDELNLKLIDGIKSISSDVLIEEKKHYIAYKINRNNFLSSSKRTDGIKLWLKGDDFEDPKSLLRDVSEMGHHGPGNYDFLLNSESDLEYILNLIKQAFEQNQGVDYSLEHHTKIVKDKKLMNYLEELRNKISLISEDINEHHTKFRIMFSSKNNFCGIGCRKDFLRISLKIDVNPKDYPELNFYEEDEKLWDYVKVDTKTPMDVLLKLIKLAFDSQ
jgi:predicted transport protein